MRTRFASGLAGIALLTLSACTTVPPVAEIPAAIANASTASDHQRIADYFAAKATSYDAEVATHERMSRSYAENPRSYPFRTWSAHCEGLKHKFVEAAQEARALEQAHRQLARELDK